MPSYLMPPWYPQALLWTSVGLVVLLVLGQGLRPKLRSEPRLWWQLLLGAICSPHYRLHGVHAKPELARKQLLGEKGTFSDPNYVDFIDLSYNNVPLMMVAMPLWDLYSRLMPAHVLRSALSTYW